jgi:hypothetical protein
MVQIAHGGIPENVDFVCRQKECSRCSVPFWVNLGENRLIYPGAVFPS